MSQSNVIALNVPHQRQSLRTRLALHGDLFANQRRSEDDVFWLKENAEFLNITESTGLPGDAILDTYVPIYQTIDRRLGDYPQYYRFLLSICLDLEDLGMPGNKGEAMCAWVRDQGLVDAELSDLQRAEATRLLARREIHADAGGVPDRLRRFIDRPRTFAIPNKKAAYELTHIVFYLSEYGRLDPKLSDAALLSLHFAGLQAYLDQNYDLLAEICIALRYAGQQPSRIWERVVCAAVRSAQSTTSESRADDYHAYLVSTWLMSLRDESSMGLALHPGQTRIVMPTPPAQLLPELGAFLQDTRKSDWETVRDMFTQRLSPAALQLLRAAETSTDRFSEFFEIFARAQSPCVAQLATV